MKVMIKKITILSLIFMMAFATAFQVAPESSVAAASTTYSGKIYKHWCKLRTKKSMSSKVIKRLEKGTKVEIHSTSGKWRKVTVGNDTGYVLKKYVYINTTVSKVATGFRGASKADQRQLLVTYAKLFVGNSYVWGGTSLNDGADCSGFTQGIYRAFGYSIPRTSSSQRSAGKKVKYKNKKVGDLICYSGHVAIYIGNGQIVHASSRKTGIKISPKANYRKIVSVRRIIK